MSRLETEVFQSGHPLLPHVFLRRRYVDDIFCIWNGPVDSIDYFLEFLNSLYPSIDFYVEIGNSKLNFLDLTLTLLPNQFDFEIYRKTTTTDILIHGTSFNPFPHKTDFLILAIYQTNMIIYVKLDFIPSTHSPGLLTSNTKSPWRNAPEPIKSHVVIVLPIRSDSPAPPLPNV